jgi:hypothetical protein
MTNVSRRGFLTGMGAMAAAIVVAKLPIPETDEQRFMRLAKTGALIQDEVFVFRTPFVISGVTHLTINRCDITCVNSNGEIVTDEGYRGPAPLVTFDRTCDYLTISNCILRAV